VAVWRRKSVFRYHAYPLFLLEATAPITAFFFDMMIESQPTVAAAMITAAGSVY
jgi:hypothetical protein